MAVKGRLPIPLVVAVSVVLLLIVFLSDKSICGLGPSWLSNTVQVVAFVALVGGLTMADTCKENSCRSLRLWGLHRGLSPG